MATLTEDAIDIKSAYEHIKMDGAGSVVVHLGIVKPSIGGESTQGIRFAAIGDLKGELDGIESELMEKYGLIDITIYRRIGELAVGDCILAVLVSSPGRIDAFNACMEAVERLKKLKNIEKEELYT